MADLSDLPSATEYADFANYEEAMSAIAQNMSEPWSWNKWQQMTKRLVPTYPATVPKDNKENARIRRQIMEEVFGPE